MTKTDLHRLVDQLPDDAVDLAGQLLENIGDPFVRALAGAPLDDEPYTADERETDRRAMLEPAIPWEQAKRELEAG